MKKYETLIFDLDGTLAVSKMPIDEKMANILSKATKQLNIAVITGGLFTQIEKQVIERLTKEADLSKVYVLPTSGSKMFSYDKEQGGWEMIYAKMFTEEQTEKVIGSVKNAMEKASFTIDPDVLMGEQIEDRGSQITLSALGQEQLPEVKKAWDPERDKRRELRALMIDLEDEYDVKIGGLTSIDITLKGFDKEFGINTFFKISGFEKDNALFVGDEIVPEGNDWAATKTGIETRDTTGPDQTIEIVKEILGGQS